VRLTAAAAPDRARVFVVRDDRRAAAVRACPEALDFLACQGRDVAVKANYNSGDGFPASTHPETLAALLEALKERRAAGLTLAERSGMGDTRRVLERTEASNVLTRGARPIVLDDAGPRPGRHSRPPTGPVASTPRARSRSRRARSRPCAARRTASVAT
jgi:uncharacterized protein (DUF362 family)